MALTKQEINGSAAERESSGERGVGSHRGSSQCAGERSSQCSLSNEKSKEVKGKAQMGKSKKATPVTLTAAQRKRLEHLWFIFGNYGPKTTYGNHQFIQHLLEHGVDLRPSFTTRTRKRDRPTAECEAAVETVLRMANERTKLERETSGTGQRVIHSERPKEIVADRELKAMIDKIRLRQRESGSAVVINDDTPDAA